MNPETHRLTGSSEHPTLHIDVFSDVVCPWCFIGKRRLDKAVNDSNGRYTHRITWRPFELNPTMPRAGTDRKAYLEKKFGGPAARQALEARVAAVGKSEGIPFAFERIQRSPNTFDAHRLIWLAQREGHQDPVVEELFRAYFIEGQDIGDRRTLVEVAGLAGLDPRDRPNGSLKTMRGARPCGRRKRKGDAWASPAFLTSLSMTRLAVSGAQTAETLASVFEQAMRANGSHADALKLSRIETP